MSTLTEKISSFSLRAQLGKAYQTAGVLFEVSCAVNKTEQVEEVAPELDMYKKGRKSLHHTTFYPWILLGLHSPSCNLMRLDFRWPFHFPVYLIKAAVGALWNTRGLNWPASFEPQRQKADELDLLDWLRAMFGFQQEIQQRKILYMGLYLLIWGEAAKVRFMPECLCYIFHNMDELHGLLAGNVSIVTGENIKPSYGGDDEAFLRKVITPIYRVISKV
ncbi:hypothetical protein Tsubulata_045612 [Turnera subulata]|uniref:1,3-beta-glucan synthase component FKS1-like domain-containing protein n=1 Tax=Turnera subulata TaxID=218843 RepID=A0A9Q0JCH6_9ROSI|nr:hypothetical protein Tsubulata_045612 [Turnera subulata]